MTLQRWLDRLRHELRRQGLPRCHVDRLVEELTDHAKDIFTENQSMDAEQNLERMGTPEQLATVANNEFKRSTFVGRHPVPTFVAGPVISMFAMLYAGMIMIGFSCCVLDWMMGWETVSITFVNGFFQCGSLVDRIVALGGSTMLFVYLGRRTGHFRWSLVACAIIAITPFFFTSIVVPKTDQHLGLFTVGIGFDGRLDRIWQSVVPLGFGLCIYWQSSRSRSNKVSFL